MLEVLYDVIKIKNKEQSVMKYKESFNQSTTCPNWKERAAQNPDDAVASIFAWVGQTITEPS